MTGSGAHSSRAAAPAMPASVDPTAMTPRMKRRASTDPTSTTTTAAVVHADDPVVHAATPAPTMRAPASGGAG